MADYRVVTNGFKYMVETKTKIFFFPAEIGYYGPYDTLEKAKQVMRRLRSDDGPWVAAQDDARDEDLENLTTPTK